MWHPQTIVTQTVCGATAIGLFGILSFYWFRKKSTYAVPSKWEPVGKVKSLYIYPLKSGRGIELDKAICTEYGFLMLKSGRSCQFYDRNLLIYKESDKEFRTGKHYPKMVFIEAKPHATDEESFTLAAPGMPTVTIKIPNPKSNKEDEIVYYRGGKMHTIDCGDEAAKWISSYLLENNSGLRLGYHDTLHRRNINKSHEIFLPIYPRFRNESTGMYTDFTSYMMVNQASVDELNGRISDEKVTPLHFRPNILVEGEKATPYAEDSWNWIKIGDVILYFAKPCARCLVTTIGPETGVRSKSNEPLKTLKTYRLLKDLLNIELEGSDPVMGIHLGLHNGGEISVGDTVYVGHD